MAPVLPIILLPPSEGKAAGGEGEPWTSGRMRYDLDDERARTIKALTSSMRWSGVKRAKLLGVKGDALAAATAANLDLLTAPTLPAIDRYTGVLYEALDVATLKAAERRRLDQSVVIFSALWGLVSPDDPLPSYKVKMGAALPRLGRLSTWWRPHLTRVLDVENAGRRIWNLLPQEHDAAWVAPVDREILSVRFLDERPDGSVVAVSHWNKLLKGALVRFLLEHPSADARDLSGWDHPLGYRLDESRTDLRDGVTVLSLVKVSESALS